jgi:predicted methyltransferase
MRAFSLVVVAGVAGVVSACATGGSGSSEDPAVGGVPVTVVAGTPAAPAGPAFADMAVEAARAANRAALAAALAAPGRSAEDRERDVRDRPLEVLALANWGPGDKIADIFGGGGYYAEILSQVVGESGTVRLINNPSYDGFSKKGREPRLADNRLPNVSYEVLPPSDMQLGAGGLDGALIVMSYHDLYVVGEKGWPEIDASQFIDQIVRALKPGGRLLIVDHHARPGSGKSDASSLHRIDEAFAKADFAAHGLELVGTLDLLRAPADDHTLNVFDPAIRGKTDRFVHLYRKP